MAETAYVINVCWKKDILILTLLLVFSNYLKGYSIKTTVPWIIFILWIQLI